MKRCNVLEIYDEFINLARTLETYGIGIPYPGSFIDIL